MKSKLEPQPRKWHYNRSHVLSISTSRHLDDSAHTWQQAVSGTRWRGTYKDWRIPVEFCATWREGVGSVWADRKWCRTIIPAAQNTFLTEATEFGALEVHVALQHGNHTGHAWSFLRRCLHAQEGYVEDSQHLDLVVNLQREAWVYQLLHSVFLTQRPCLQLHVVNYWRQTRYAIFLCFSWDWEFCNSGIMMQTNYSPILEDKSALSATWGQYFFSHSQSQKAALQSCTRRLSRWVVLKLRTPVLNSLCIVDAHI